MKIICIGRNYRAHAAELNNPVPTKPLIFLKPDTSLVRNNKDIYYPEFTQDLHFECELVIRISREGKFIQPDFVHTYVDGIGIGLDLTARDVQSEAKEKGHPWTLAKMFNNSAPVSKFLPPEQFPDLQNVRFRCDINGETRQEGHTSDMIFSVNEIISYVTQFITVKKGDLIFTGTPKGVGPLHIDDHIEGYLEGDKLLDFHVR
ncbi:fumarylacetoacetate hydrolase family protein [Pontibacter sp. G13]|uniref:fumarylacetoacetate hydrolase family protein n=1 Tax=Pontibacter sp. G13 TaxID=3074898 RepID=UPI00288C2949|nr:fumarylacetoacetate hydrolase family protein [Pontibacter sp. G13]WNJ16142.1 fumarylacetoacetate hydrolase family protein [Pontibacter sp. G13]